MRGRANIKDDIELDHNVDEDKDKRPIGMGDMGNQQSLESRVIVRAIEPLVTAS